MLLIAAIAHLFPSSSHFTQYISNATGSHTNVTQATADFPTSSFPIPMMYAYPNAKVILNTRRPASVWFDSLRNTILHARNQFHDKNAPPDAWATWMTLEFNDDFEANGLARFEAHERAILDTAEKQGREVMVYECSEGWEPLCRFLGKEVPQGLEFPRKDDWAEYKKEPTWENLKFLHGGAAREG